MSCPTCRGPHLCSTCQALLERATQGATSTPPMRLPRPLLLAEDMAPEWRFEARVIAAAVAQGYKAFHPHRNKRHAEGYWDLTMVKPGRPMLCIELKTNTGVVDPEQAAWLEAARQSSSQVIAEVWRPADWQHLLDVLGY